nr:hypothetical protein CFP56_67821 [Quercus suber]
MKAQGFCPTCVAHAAGPYNRCLAAARQKGNARLNREGHVVGLLVRVVAQLTCSGRPANASKGTAKIPSVDDSGQTALIRRGLVEEGFKRYTHYTTPCWITNSWRRREMAANGWPTERTWSGHIMAKAGGYDDRLSTARKFATALTGRDGRSRTSSRLRLERSEAKVKKSMIVS